MRLPRSCASIAQPPSCFVMVSANSIECQNNWVVRGEGGRHTLGKLLTLSPGCVPITKEDGGRSIEAYDDQTENGGLYQRLYPSFSGRLGKRKEVIQKQSERNKREARGKGVEGRGWEEEEVDGTFFLLSTFTLPRVSSPFPGLRAGLL